MSATNVSNGLARTYGWGPVVRHVVREDVEHKCIPRQRTNVSCVKNNVSTF